MANEYDSVIAEMDAETSGRVKRSIYSAVDTNPDQESALHKISRRSGIPVEGLRLDNGEEAKRRIASQDAEALTAVAPRTADFLSNLENAKIAHDDVDSLTHMERVIRDGFSKTINGPISTLGIASPNDTAYARRVQSELRKTSGVLADPKKRADYFAGVVQRVKAGTLKGVGGLSTMIGENMTQPLRDMMGYEEESGFLTAGRSLREKAKAISEAAAADYPVEPHSWLAAGSSALESMGQQVPMWLGAFLTKNPSAVLTGMGGLSAGQEYADLRERGIKPQNAAVGAIGTGTVEAATEAWPTRILWDMMKPEAKRSFVKLGNKMVEMYGAEIVGESGATFFQDVIDKVYTKPGMTASEIQTELANYLESGEAFTNFIDTVKATAIQTTLTGGAGVGISHTRKAIDNRFSKATAAKENAATMESLGGIVKNSKTWQRLPEKAQDAIQGYIDHHDAVENISVPVEYWQSALESQGLDPAKVAEDVLSDPSAYYEALATGSEVVIPMADYATKIAPSEYHQALVKDIRLHPGGMTAREAEEFERSTEKESLLKDLYEDSAQSEELDTSQKVYDSILGELLGVGRDRSTAERESLLWQSRYRARAERLGRDAWEMYQENPVRVRRIELGMQADNADAAQGATFNQSPQSRQGSETLSVRKTQTEGMLLPAVLKDGEVRAAGIGATHYDVHSTVKAEVAEGITEANGFVTPDNRFLDRKQALAWVKENRPDVYKMLDKETKANGLESQAYAHAEGMGGDTASVADDFIKKQFGGGGLMFFQKYSEGKRGSITFSPGFRDISLLEKADLSTFLHESGHAWLEEFRQDAQMEDAPDQIKADFATLAAWGGFATDVSTIPVEAHEKFARAVEAYLMEGNAPSVELQPAFQRFKAWLMRIYRSLQGLNVQLTDEVRGVMDRLLATDEEIKRAEDMQSFHPLFTDAASAGMTEREFNAYRKEVERAHNEAETRLQQRLMADLTREQKAWWKEEREKIRGEVETEAKQSRVYQAMQMLTNGKDFDGNEAPEGFKLSKNDLVRMYGKEFVKRLPRSFQYIYSKEGGMHPDIVAEMYGFNSGDQMVREMANTPPMKKFVEAETDIRMRQVYGDMLNDGTIADEALKAIHSDYQGQVLRAELRALKRKQREVSPFVKAEKAKGEDALSREKKELEYERRWMDAEKKLALEMERGAKEEELRQLRDEIKANKEAQRKARLEMEAGIPPLESFKLWAAQTVGTKTVGALRPDLYARAEQKYGRESFPAASKGDYAKARESKQLQLLNHYLYLESVKAREEVDNVLSKFKKAFRSDEKISKGRDMDLVNAARAILGSYGIGPQTENPLAFLYQVQQYNPQLFEDLQIAVETATQEAKPYKELTFDEFMSVRDAVENLLHLARREKVVEIDGHLVATEEVIDELSASLVAEGIPDRTGKYATAGKMERVSIMFSGMRAAGRRVEHWADARDGGKMDGPFRRFIWQPVSEAADRYRVAKAEYIKAFRELFKPVEDSLQLQEIEAPELGISGTTFRSKAELLMAILHTGNKSNMEKLLVGRGWGFIAEDGGLDTSAWDSFIRRMWIEGTITQSDYEFAQSVWDLLEKLKPEAQQAHRKMYGYYFSEVTADTVNTPWGAYRGGYVPAVTDPFRVQDQALREDRESLLYENQTSMFPTPARGFTKKRVDYNKPLSLDMHLLPAHIDKVLKFVHLAPPVRDVAKIVTNQRFREVLDQFDPSAAGDMLTPWLTRAVRQTVETRSTGWGGKALDTVASALRKRTGLQLMVLNVANTIQQFTGLSISLTKVKGGHLAGALWNFIRSPQEVAELVAERSPFMQDRLHGDTFKMMGEVDRLLDESKLAKVRDFAIQNGYILQHITQNIVDVATWLGRYNQSISEGSDEKEAVRAADSAVRETQGSFAPEDISRIEGGSPFVRLFTQFWSYFNMQANLLGTEFKNTVDEYGYRAGSGRLFLLYVAGFMIPAVLSEVIMAAARGRLDDDDDGEYWDDILTAFFGGQFKTGAAMVPGGQVFVSVANRFNRVQNDDRISVSPAVSALESIGGTAYATWKLATEGEIKRQGVKDTLTAIGIASGLPMGAIGRPLGYLTALERGDTEPENYLDAARGFATGYAPR